MEIKLDICDDGRGFDPDQIPPDRMGLGIMRERAEAVGAQLEIVSQTGRGTRLTVTWPRDNAPRPTE
jgi:signal transduction histidine kinase